MAAPSMSHSASPAEVPAVGRITLEFVSNLWDADTGVECLDPPVGLRVGHHFDEEAVGIVLGFVPGPIPHSLMVRVLWSRGPDYSPRFFQNFTRLSTIERIECNVTIA